MQSVFLNDWKDSSADDVFEEFSGERWAYNEDERPAMEQEKFQGWEILLATYSYADYSGNAFLLLRKDGKLFEVNGGHCSCYGLEGQFDPEETTVAALQHRIKDGRLGVDYYDKNEFADELTAVLEALSAEGQE